MHYVPLLRGKFSRFWIRSKQSRLQVPILLLAAVALWFLYGYVFIDEDPSSSSTEAVDLKSLVIFGKDDMNMVDRNKRSFSDATGCNVPKLDTFGKELMPFVSKAEPMECSERAGEENWVDVDEEGSLIKQKGREAADCTIEYFKRKSDNENEKFGKEPVSGQKMKSDFGIVQCKMNGTEWSLPMMAAVRNETIVAQKAKPDEKNKPMDVLIFGFDSMSQQHFRRKMPKTVKWLEMMNAVILNGYNIVGDGTPQAFIPILTGKTELELPNTRKRYGDANYINVYPMVWNKYAEKDYVTLFGEDAFEIGMFNYRLKGFDKQPTDHFTRNFYREAEAAEGSFQKKLKSLASKKAYRGKCLGSDPYHKSWFRYSRQFLKAYKDLPKFMLMHQDSMSHDDINLIEVEDEDFTNHLETMERDGLLSNAVLIVMADHGHRFTKIRDTHQGQMEERLPMFSVTLPKEFGDTEKGKQMLHNLKVNKDVLTTPFDIHQTLLDVLDSPKDVDHPQSLKTRSLSLFRPIPAKRTCEEAGVEAHWCTCLNWQNATQTERDVQQTEILAEGLTEAIDKQLENVRDLCSRVVFKKVISASKLIPNGGVFHYKTAKDHDGFVPDLTKKGRAMFAHYRLKILTSPNDAVYEGTVFFDERIGQLEVDLTSLSHVNAYGDDPHCVVQKHNTLALYCVCHDRVRKR